MLLSAHGSMIFFASSKSLLKKQWIAFFASIIAVSKSIDASLDKNFLNVAIKKNNNVYIIFQVNAIMEISVRIFM